MQHAWSTNDQADTRFTRQVSIGRRSISSSLFVSEANKADSQIYGCFCDADNRDADDTENDSDA